MAEVAFTPAEQARIEQIANELDVCLDEFFADARELLSDEQWDTLTCYVRACIRRALEVGALLHAVVDARCDSIPYRGRGREVFVRQGFAAWKDSFTPVADVWHVASVFALAPGGEQRVLADVTTLEVMAANRMFAPLDDQLDALSDPSA